MKLYWTVSIGIEDLWVGDGFELTEEGIREMVIGCLYGAYDHEVDVKLLQTPQQVDLDKVNSSEYWEAIDHPETQLDLDFSHQNL